jgi:hypothetical protein
MSLFRLIDVADRVMDNDHVCWEVEKKILGGIVLKTLLLNAYVKYIAALPDHVVKR